MTSLSYWEHTTWFKNIDYAIIGSGIVGLSCALHLRERYPKAKIVVFERGVLPSGASTKNAGFACFGSVSEILDDLKTHSENDVINLVKERVTGLQLLRKLLGDEAIDFQAHGGYELFTQSDAVLYEECIEKIPYVNSLLKDVFRGQKDVFSIKNDPFSFGNVQKQLIFNEFESQLDTGKMMREFILKCAKNSILIMNSTHIDSFFQKNEQICLKTNISEEIHVDKLIIATNGFASQFLNLDIQPARAQVLITKPIKDLKIKGTFHLDRGYYYFRNIENRILFGGGRNLDKKGETITQLDTTDLIQSKLEELLGTTILPETTFEIDARWSGIMGVGTQKKPIVQEIQPNVFCGVRLGGMGVAIGSSIGKQLANLVESTNV